MRFHDFAKLELVAGDGGGGCVAFRREKFVPRGGPNGGDGGRGGHVFARAVEGLNTLLDYRYRRRVACPRGGNGQGKNRSGQGGKDVWLDLPRGTQIFDEGSGTMLADLVEMGDEVLLCRGGRGGYGNAHFRSATHRSPRMAQEGGEGEMRRVILRLKVLADVGLAGLPNAGKSSLLRAVSRSRTKVAEYPYTTLRPHLGFVLRGYREAVFADLPGLIRGASEGLGLGHRFLGHMERCSVLLQLAEVRAGGEISTMAERIMEDFDTIGDELERYGCGLLEKRRFFVVTKGDLLETGEAEALRETLEMELGKRSSEKRSSGEQSSEERSSEGIFVVSSVTGEGVERLLEGVFAVLEEKEKETEMELEAQERKEVPSPSLCE